MTERLNPIYLAGLTARNRLTDARDAVYRLIETLPVSRQQAAAQIYQELCAIQGRLEKLLEDVPTSHRVETSVGEKL